MRRPDWTKNDDLVLALSFFGLVVLGILGMAFGIIDAQR